MARGRPLSPLTITEDERSELRGWPRRRKTAQAMASRARSSDPRHQDVRVAAPGLVELTFRRGKGQRGPTRYDGERILEQKVLEVVTDSTGSVRRRANVQTVHEVTSRAGTNRIHGRHSAPHPNIDIPLSRFSAKRLSCTDVHSSRLRAWYFSPVRSPCSPLRFAMAGKATATA